MSPFNEKLQSAPFIRLLVPFIAGIVSGDWFSPELKWLFLGASIFFSIVLCFLVTTSYRKASRFGMILASALFFLGLFISADRKYIPRPLAKGEYFAVIGEFPLEREKSYRAIIRLAKPKIKVLAYFEKTDLVASAEPGNVIWFRGKPELLRKTGNPFEFDYQEYAIRNGIGHRIYLRDKDIYFLPGEKNLNLMDLSLIIRDRLLKIIENCGLKGEIFHLVSSISLGAREELEPETTQSFAKTGVIHVLAVSGMNVAIIFIVLDLMLRSLKKRKGGMILHTLLILAAVWGYALITGLSASVLRAAAMFSFIVIGKNMSRHPDIYNSLAASAFVLFCIHPSLVYDVGFQLSYAAVFSIVYFHPYIYHLFYFKYWIPDQIWGLLTVSVAAQVGTLPLLLHYFHQFPTWFLLANLMVIPLVSLILYLTFIVFAVAPIVPFLGVLMARALGLAGEGMLFSVHFVEQLPYSLLEGLYPSDRTLFLLVIFGSMTVLFIVYKNHLALTAALISMIMLLLFSNIDVFRKYSRKEIVVFNLSGKTLISFTKGTKTVWLTTNRNNTPEKLTYFTKPYEGFRGIKKATMICLSDSSVQKSDLLFTRANFLNFEGISICIFPKQNPGEINWKVFPHIDLAILSEKSTIDPIRLLENIPGSRIIDCRSTSPEGEATQNQLIESADQKIFNTNVGGAVKITFNPETESEEKRINLGYFNQ